PGRPRLGIAEREWPLWPAQPSWTGTDEDGFHLQWPHAGPALYPEMPGRWPARALLVQARTTSWFAICPDLFHVLQDVNHELGHGALPTPEMCSAQQWCFAQAGFVPRLSPSAKKPIPLNRDFVICIASCFMIWFFLSVLKL